MKYACAFLSRSIPSLLSRSKLLTSRVQPASPPLTCIEHHFQPIRFLTWKSSKNQEEQTQGAEEVNPIILRHPERDRRKVVSVETSIRYLKSAAFKEAYGDKPVWFYYRRNHKGFLPPKKTRRLCIRADVVATGSPCPICRDEYLIVDYQNLDLLKQFISPISGTIITYEKTGVCQKQHNNLLVAFEKAKDLGLITYDVPHRSYNYSDYQPDS